MRRIWNAGEAPVAVSHAAFWQVTAGCGYFYIANDWIDDGSFEQDLFVRLVRDPTAVIDDPLIELPTGEDRRFLSSSKRWRRKNLRNCTRMRHGGRGSVAFDGVVRR